MQPASPFQGFYLYRSASRGASPGLCCWTLSGSQLQSYSSAIRFISPFSRYIMRARDITQVFKNYAIDPSMLQQSRYLYLLIPPITEAYGGQKLNDRALHAFYS